MMNVYFLVQKNENYRLNKEIVVKMYRLSLFICSYDRTKRPPLMFELFMNNYPLKMYVSHYDEARIYHIDYNECGLVMDRDIVNNKYYKMPNFSIDVLSGMFNRTVSIEKCSNRHTIDYIFRYGNFEMTLALFETFILFNCREVDNRDY